MNETPSIWLSTGGAAQAVGVPEHTLRNAWARHKGWRSHPMLPLAVPRPASHGRLFWKAEDLYVAAGMIPNRSNSPAYALRQHLTAASGADPLQAHLIASGLLADGPHSGANPAGALAEDIKSHALMFGALASRTRETLTQVEGDLTPDEWSALNRAADELDHALQAVCRPLRWRSPEAARPADMFAGQRRNVSEGQKA